MHLRFVRKHLWSIRNKLFIQTKASEYHSYTSLLRKKHERLKTIEYTHKTKLGVLFTKTSIELIESSIRSLTIAKNKKFISPIQTFSSKGHNMFHFRTLNQLSLLKKEVLN